MRFEEDERELATVVPRRRLHHYFLDEHHQHISNKKLFGCYKDLAAAMLDLEGITTDSITPELYYRLLKNKQAVISHWVYFRIPLKPETVERVYTVLKALALERIKKLCPNGDKCASCILTTSCIEDPFNRRFKAVYGYIPNRVNA